MQMSIDDSWTFYQVNLLIHTFSKHINLASISTGNKEQVHRRLFRSEKTKKKSP